MVKKPKRVLVVGGVAGGATAAARIRRLDEECEIIMFERGGPHVSFSNCALPFHLSGLIEDHEDLILMKPDDFYNQYRIDARVYNEVIAIDRENKEVKVKKTL